MVQDIFWEFQGATNFFDGVKLLEKVLKFWKKKQKGDVLSKINKS